MCLYCKKLNDAVVLTILWLSSILIYAEIWALISSRTQVQTQIILEPDYLPDYPSVSYDNGFICNSHVCLFPIAFLISIKFLGVWKFKTDFF